MITIKNVITINLILRVLLFFAIICLCNSCRSDLSKWKTVSTIAQDNKDELKTVLDFYKNKGKKYEAAKFLIYNMGHSYTTSSVAKIYRDKVLSCDQKQDFDSLWFTMRDSMDFRSIETVYDAAVIKASYLIDNIEEAFKTWENVPWHNQIDFDIFCNYILPYRVSVELISEWRNFQKEKYEYLIEGVTDPKQAFGIVYNHLIKIFAVRSLKYPYTPDVVLSDKLMQGVCSLRSIYIVSVMRSLGIPASYDFIDYWANYSTSGHSWVSYVGETGKTYTITAPDTILLENNKIDASLIRANNIPNRFKYKVDTLKRVSKIYRRSYAYKTDIRYLTDYVIPEFFRYPFVEDVSDMYYMTQCSTAIRTRESNNIYLCTFASIYDWVPVAKECQKNGKAKFKNIGGGIVYLPVYYDEDGFMRPLSNPFILSEDGNRKVLNPDTLLTQRIVLRRKYVLFAHWLSRWSKAIDARFEVSDDPEFKNVELLYQIKEIPDGITRVYFNPTKNYRYVRVQVRKDARPDFAEMAFWGENTKRKQKGKLIYKDITEESVLKATDGDYTTHGGSRLEHYWFGLDLGPYNKEKITSAEFCMRHDLNMVEAGHIYELFYYDKDWISLGKQLATCDSLVYNVPAGALYWLKDHTEGREERIFTYEDNQQIWW